ncbi:putative dead deah box helicase [Diplodia seriata]|uniref:Putative dead deah box helicase n=1 Tax=Diplodia seriata TaxID=420778 RepID=A0A0G2HKV3_9PEZI|nr:putative dead deah box helicase [Diplodia seriata]
MEAADAPQPPNWGDYYRNVYSRRVDLVGDYAGSEPFLVDGDSLLLHCFSDELLDFTDGFQMLHAVWLVEHFLHNLQRRNCNFDLAFFDDRDHLCIPPHASDAQSAKYRLARAVIIRHLQVNLAASSSPIKLLVFPSLVGEQFETALTANAYLFVMMNDGAVDTCQCDRHRNAKDELRLAICSFLTRGYGVALINGLEWRDTKVITAVIEGMAQTPKPETPAAKHAAVDQACNPDAPIFGRELYDVLTEHRERTEQKLSERLYLVIATAANLVSAGDLPQADIASFFLHAVLQSQLSLESRSFSSSTSTEASQRVLERFSGTALAVMKSPLWETFVDEAQLPCDISDLVDGRLYNMVLAKQIPLPKLGSEFERIIGSLVALDTVELGRQSELEDVPKHTPEQSSESYRKLLPFSSEGFDKHLEPVKLDIDSQAVQQPNDKDSRAFRELTHWHNNKRPLNRKAVMTAKERSNFYARRRDQRFMAEMMAYAASLTNAVGKALEPETIIIPDKPAATSHTGKNQQQSGQAAKSGGGKNKKKQDMMDKIAADHEKKEAVQNQKVFNAWHAVLKDIQREKQPATRYSKTSQYLNSLSSAKQAVIGTEVEFYALNCLLELWKVSMSSNAKSPNLGLAGRIWDAVRHLSDGWQREVLDVLDAKKSLIVVAPTSAGKTFISFYAMKKVLEGSDDGVLVYVAPTKALVNQIAAEIQARFSKTYKHAGKSVWGIHTRDYRVNNATGCQVLVTVPHVLQDMLLAPKHASSWSSRVKRIIFDEVHCIGQADDGIVWEQLLLLSPCPIVALSATVGNPEEFRSWLASTQKATGNDLVMVHHPHRYSDLRKYVFVPPKELVFKGLPKAPAVPRVDLDRGEDFQFVHPVASLLNRSRAIPEDFSLEARDCFTLWKAMKAHESDTHAVPDSLDPKQALPGVITQAAIITWLWAKKMDDWEKWKKSRKGTSKGASKKPSAVHEKGMSKADLEKESASTEIDSWENFDPDAPLDGFHFKDGSKLQQSELEKYADELRYRGVPDWLIEALSRGIAVHHAGMNRKYRHVVELLFRKGYLRVVVATGTLAMGVNMPCKTVVFCGDSVFLTALNFRQAAGRAGRRGFDVLGNVVFHGIPVSKVSRLLSSRLPDLTGHFPITTTLVLRLSTLLSESKHSTFAVQAVDALLSQPRLYLGGEENRMTVLHHLRFSLEYLRRQFLLDQSGNPLNFASCVSQLYYTESSNFAFHTLLKDGYFHRLCVGIRNTPTSAERILHTLMLVMSHLFGRLYCRHVDRESIQEVTKNSPSSVLLPPLPADAAAALRAHNRDALDIFKTYVRTYAAQHLHDPDNILPLSRVKCGGDGSDDAGSSPIAPPSTIRSPFVALSGHADDASIRTIDELCHTVRAGVYLEEAVIPHVPVHRSSEGDENNEDDDKSDLPPLNAYLLDFFKHGDVTALADANGIRRGDVWFVLSDFSSVLATIVASLEGFVKANDGGDAVEGAEETMEEKADRLLEANTDTAAAAAGLAGKENKVLPARGKKVSKKNVAESWDDQADDDDAADALASAADEAFDAPGWEDEGDGSLLDVLAAFKMLSDEFNEKFKAMWA